MTRQEIEKAIENGESVYDVYKNLSGIYEINTSDFEYINDNILIWGKEFYCNIRDLFKTKAEAEHYLHHANVTRIETLPFLTWEEFLKKKVIRFVDNSGEVWHLYYCYSDEFTYIYLQSLFGYNGEKTRNPQNLGELTEANFYKAYDECVRLFKEAKNEN